MSTAHPRGDHCNYRSFENSKINLFQMEDVLRAIRDLKSDAKYDRERGHFESAAAHLAGDEGAIPLIRQQLSTGLSAEWKTQLGSELADCLGLLGGIHRRWALSLPEPQRSAQLKASVEAYQQGYLLEEDPAYHIADSYNRLNRLVSYILLHPESFSKDKPAGTTPGDITYDIRQELASAASAIKGQLDTPVRRGDIWAMADLALVRLLLDADAPDLAYADFNAQSPPGYAYESVLSTLRPLAGLPLPVQPKLKAAVTLLEKRRKALPG
jgi:hypothetical protein